MGLTATDKGGADFAPAPRGTHIARCCWVIDLGTQTHPQYGDSYQVLIGWELPNARIEDGERKGEPYFISKFYRLSLHEKANLRRDLEAWRDKGFTKEELAGFDVRKLAGIPCQLTIIHEEKKDGGTRAKVSGVAGLPHGMKPAQVPAQENPSRVYVIEEHDDETFNALPEWVQKKVNESQERQGARYRPEPPPAGDDAFHPDPDDSEVPF